METIYDRFLGTSPPWVVWEWIIQIRNRQFHACWSHWPIWPPPFRWRTCSIKKHQEGMFFQTHLKPSRSYSQIQVINSYHQYSKMLMAKYLNGLTFGTTPPTISITPKLRWHKFDQTVSRCHRFPCLPQLWLQHLKWNICYAAQESLERGDHFFKF